MSDECGSVLKQTMLFRCNKPAGHDGLHRETFCAQPDHAYDDGKRFKDWPSDEVNQQQPQPLSSPAPQMDTEQVRQNGGPPCYALLGDKMPDGVTPKYCGRAERWPGHGHGRKYDHAFVSSPAPQETPELLPCPFCGAKDTFGCGSQFGGADDLVIYGCKSCRAIGPAANSLNGAAAAWNRRASHHPSQQAGAPPSTPDDDPTLVLLMQFAGWLTGKLRIRITPQDATRHVREFLKELAHDRAY